MKKTKIISAFPACGKTYAFEKLNENGYTILDSDSSKFSWCYDYNQANSDKIEKYRNPEFPSYYNVGLVCDLFENTTGVSFPKLPNEEWIDSKDYKLNLIKPSDMSMYCEMILNGTEVDDIDMRSRFEWFKNLSDDGYYIAYDYD